MPRLPLALPALLLGLALPPAAAGADVYRCDGPDGSVHFSDRPCAADARKLEGFGPRKPAASKSEPKPARPAKPAPAPSQASRRTRGRAVVELRGGGEVTLKTETMRSSRGMSWHLGNNLALPSGLKMAYLQMESLEVKEADDASTLVLEVTMRDGKTWTEKLEKPWVSISGESEVGRFSKPLKEVERVRFD